MTVEISGENHRKVANLSLMAADLAINFSLNMQTLIPSDEVIASLSLEPFTVPGQCPAGGKTTLRKDERGNIVINYINCRKTGDYASDIDFDIVVTPEDPADGGTTEQLQTASVTEGEDEGDGDWDDGSDGDWDDGEEGGGSLWHTQLRNGAITLTPIVRAPYVRAFHVNLVIDDHYTDYSGDYYDTSNAGEFDFGFTGAGAGFELRDMAFYTDEEGIWYEDPYQFSLRAKDFSLQRGDDGRITYAGSVGGIGKDWEQNEFPGGRVQIATTSPVNVDATEGSVQFEGTDKSRLALRYTADGMWVRLNQGDEQYIDWMDYWDWLTTGSGE